MAILKRLSINLFDYPRIFRFILNAWPPYLGAAIKVERIAADWRTIEVAMAQRWYNSNYVRKHFGGSLFAMTDPFYFLMLMKNLGPAYIVWDAATEIRFLKPGEGRVTASFHVDEAQLASIREKLSSKRRILEKFEAEILDASGDKVAAVVKTLYLRKKKDHVSAPGTNNAP